jgi:hypothetical protein
VRTAQELFDTVAKHLLTQNAKSRDGGDLCFYRDPNGLKCAVGCLIPDDEYRPEMENRTVAGMLYYRPELLTRERFEEIESNIDLLTDLQIVHDDRKIEMWREELRIVANHFELKADVLETIPAAVPAQ